MHNLFDLTGKTAIVTGCNRGLGQAIALALAQGGANIFGVNASGFGDTPEKIEAAGRVFLGHKADLSSMEAVEPLVAKAVEAFGKIDILVNNAGIIRREDILKFSAQDWDDVMNVNLRTLFFLSQAVCKQFIKQGGGGKIINIASMLSFQGGIRVPSYTAAKSGVAGLTKAMANELAKEGININAIAPGYMATDNTKALREDRERNQAILARIPQGRWGQPEDLAGAALFLASRASDYVNGHVLAVDGGWLAR